MVDLRVTKMKLSSCLKRHSYGDYIGIVVDATKGIKFYTVSNIIQDMPNLFNYKVTNIRAVNGKFGFSQHDVPVVVYHLGI